ncbi:hypothetical protein TrST_g3027 [Triparma strigata]|uniref:Uncharacterized protein n=1 Tax=Triparma strigata TaxID=1606541 RepID=A0A9W6ZKJ2_9STRA|nr:hypothetical protein TrST_g3027 [Triparma strigata]
MATLSSKKLVPGEVTTVTPPTGKVMSLSTVSLDSSESDAISALFTLSNSPVTTVAEPSLVPSPLASLLSSTVPPPLLDIDATPVTLPPRPPPSFRLAYAEACAKDNLTPDVHPGSRVSFSHPSFPEPWRVEQGNKKLFISHPSHKGEFNGYKKAMACQIELSRKGQQESWNGYTYCKGYPSISGSPGHVKWEYIGCKGTNDELCATCKIMEGKGGKKRKRPPPPSPSPHITSTTLQSWGLHLPLHSPTPITLYPGSHKNLPSSGLQTIHNKPLKILLQPNHILFYSAGLVISHPTRSDTPPAGVKGFEGCSDCTAESMCLKCWEDKGDLTLEGTVETKSRKSKVKRPYCSRLHRPDTLLTLCSCCTPPPTFTPSTPTSPSTLSTSGYTITPFSPPPLPPLKPKWSKTLFTKTTPPPPSISSPVDSKISEIFGEKFRAVEVKICCKEVGEEEVIHREWCREVIID